MKASRFIIISGGLFLILATTGCGPSKAEREAKERARIEAEEAADREAALANKAITGMNKKLGRKPPDLDLGVTPAKKPAPVAPVEAKP